MDRPNPAAAPTQGASTGKDSAKPNAASAEPDSAGRSPDAQHAGESGADAQLPVPYVPQRRRALWQWFRHLFGMTPRDDLRESLQDVLDNGHGEFHALTDKERLMLRNVLELRDVRVEDVMVPRADIDAADLAMPLIDVIRAFEDAGHSRLPVTRESLDDPVGLVHIKDVMGFITAKATVRRRRSAGKGAGKSTTKAPSKMAAKAAAKTTVRDASKSSSRNPDATAAEAPDTGTTMTAKSNGKTNVAKDKPGSTAPEAPPGSIDLSRVDLSVPLKATKLTRDVLYVPPSMPVGDLLVKMQADRMHMAIVVDEYGGTDGLVTIEDLVEEIVGEISDEHDDEEAALIVSSGANGFVADARTPIEELQSQLTDGFEPDAEMLEEIDTLGGLLFSHLGRVPVRGEIVDLPGAYEFEVIDADPRRVKRVRISPRRVAQSARGQRPALARASQAGGGSGNAAGGGKAAKAAGTIDPAPSGPSS
jgi:CBS domain containing-hemolysin-like protein